MAFKLKQYTLYFCVKHKLSHALNHIYTQTHIESYTHTQTTAVWWYQLTASAVTCWHSSNVYHLLKVALCLLGTMCVFVWCVDDFIRCSVAIAQRQPVSK